MTITPMKKVNRRADNFESESFAQAVIGKFEVESFQLVSGLVNDW